jgi:uncharacterized protein HemY
VFQSEQPATKSNVITFAVVVITALAILFGAAWFFTRV